MQKRIGFPQLGLAWLTACLWFVCVCAASETRPPDPERAIAGLFGKPEEGWDLRDAAAPVEPHPEGWMTAHHGGVPAYWSAPPRFLGNRAAALGGSLQFQVRDNRRHGWALGPDAILSGGGFTLTHRDRFDAAGKGWYVQRIALNAGAWTHAASGEAATEFELAQTLAHLDGLYLRAAAFGGGTRSDLRMVTLFAGENGHLAASGLLPQAPIPVPRVRLATKQFDFRTVKRCSELIRMVGVRNTGTAVLSLVVPKVLPPGFEWAQPPGQFENDTSFSSDISPRGVFTLKMRFKPKANQEGDVVSFDLVTTTNDPTKPVLSIPVRAVGKTNLTATPSRVAFGTVAIGKEAKRTVQIRNTASPSALCSEELLVQVEGSDNTPFSMGNTHSFFLDPSKVLKIDLFYRPTQPGNQEAQLRIARVNHDEEASQVVMRVPLTGKGKGTPRFPSMTVEPETLSFGSISTSETAQLDLTIQSNGPGGLSARVPATLPAPFRWVPQKGGPDPADAVILPAGQSATFKVEYAPTAPGTHSGNLHIISNDPLLEELDIPLSGSATSSGPQIQVLPAHLLFTHVGAPVSVANGESKDITIKNTGTGNLQGTSRRVPSGSHPHFTFTNPNVFLGPGEERTVPIKYNPQDIGNHTLDLVFDTNDPANPSFTVKLEGDTTGSPHPVVVNNGAIFGTVGQPSNSLLTFGNNGNAPVSVTLPPAPQFSWGSTEWVLGAGWVNRTIRFTQGNQVSATLRITPTQSGIREIPLSFTTDAPQFSTITNTIGCNFSGGSSAPVRSLQSRKGATAPSQKPLPPKSPARRRRGTAPTRTAPRIGTR